MTVASYGGGRHISGSGRSWVDDDEDCKTALTSNSDRLKAKVLEANLKQTSKSASAHLM